MNQLKFERMKVLSRVNRTIEVSPEQIEESLVDTAVRDAHAKFLAWVQSGPRPDDDLPVIKKPLVADTFPLERRGVVVPEVLG